MPELGKSGEVDTGFDEKFEEQWWRAERTAWAVMTALVLAGLVGVFGRGYASRRVVKEDEGRVQLSYQRIARFRTPATVEIKINESGAAASKIRLRLRGDLLEGSRVRRVLPAPQLSLVGQDGITLVYPAETGRGIKLVIEQEPGAVGLQKGEVQVDDLPPIDFHQFIFP